MRAVGPSESDAATRSTSREIGFTLIELLIAMFLLSVGILGIAQVFAVSNRHTSYAREETIAVSLAQEIREKMLSETFADLKSIFDGIDTADPETIPVPAADWAEHVADHLGPHARGTVSVQNSEEDPGLANGMLGVTVTMTWSERGRTITLPLRFAVAKTGP